VEASEVRIRIEIDVDVLRKRRRTDEQRTDGDCP
jgi:hypothetical protein